MTTEQAPRGAVRPPSNLPVQVAFRLHHETDKAWLVSPPGNPAAAGWLPKSKASRGVGRDEYVWTMPDWMARDRGWL